MNSSQEMIQKPSIEISDSALSFELQKKLDDVLEANRFVNIPLFSTYQRTETFYVPVNHGKIRVFHIIPKNIISKRPVVFVPGWGVNPRGFQDFYEVLHEKVELYYIETREKGSSEIKFWHSKFSMDQKALDIAECIKFLKLEEKDYVLMGPCWGAAVLLQGLKDRVLNPPTMVVVDPMHALWFNRTFLKYFAPIIPGFIFTILKKIIQYFKLRKMKEITQKQRAEDFIGDAVIWKWKRAAQQVCDFELFKFLPEIQSEVIVVNGTNDLIHDKRDYPKIAKLLPKGRFILLNADESDRERLMGVVAEKFAQVEKKDGIPPFLKEFEVKIER